MTRERCYPLVRPMNAQAKKHKPERASDVLRRLATRGEGDMDNLLKIAQDCGFSVVLEGRIGTQEYNSVSGPVQALEKFAEAIRDTVLQERPRQNE